MIETRLDNPLLLDLLNRFADQVIASRDQNETIGRERDPYIDRWYLARRASVPVGCDQAFRDMPAVIPSEIENLYLHRYARSDNEDMHCHPWANGSLVLRGFYVEETPEGIFRRQGGDIVLRTAVHRHRIMEVAPGTLSLFATLRKEREWGFYPRGEFVHWREFIDAHRAAA